MAVLVILHRLQLLPCHLFCPLKLLTRPSVSPDDFLLILRSARSYSDSMSIAEIKKEASSLGNEDVIHLAAWFHHLARRKDTAYLKSLDDSFEAINMGDRLTLGAYKKLSQELNQSGL